MSVLVKLQANTPPWVFFTFFKLYKWYQIVQRITYDVHMSWTSNECLKNVRVKFKYPLVNENESQPLLLGISHSTSDLPWYIKRVSSALSLLIHELLLKSLNPIPEK